MEYYNTTTTTNKNKTNNIYNNINNSLHNLKKCNIVMLVILTWSYTIYKAT